MMTYEEAKAIVNGQWSHPNDAMSAIQTIIAEVDRLRRALHVLERRQPNAIEDDQTVELAVELSYKNDEVQRLRRIEDAARLWANYDTSGVKASDNLERVLKDNPRPESDT